MRVDLPACKKCKRQFYVDGNDEEYGTDLCYYCFNDGVEEYEIKRRERIALKNEY